MNQLNSPAKNRPQRGNRALDLIHKGQAPVMPVIMTVAVVVNVHEQRSRSEYHIMILQRQMGNKKQSQHGAGISATVASALAQHPELQMARVFLKLRRARAQFHVLFLTEEEAEDGLPQGRVQNIAFGEQPAQDDVEKALASVADFEPAFGQQQLTAFQVLECAGPSEVV